MTSHRARGPGSRGQGGRSWHRRGRQGQPRGTVRFVTEPAAIAVASRQGRGSAQQSSEGAIPAGVKVDAQQ